MTLKNSTLSFIWLLTMSAILPACSPNSEEISSSKTSGAALRTIKIEPQTRISFNDYDGSIEAVRQTDLAAQVMGKVTTLNVAVGDYVKKDELLVRLDAQTASQAASASNAQLTSVRAQLNLAKQEYERQKQLYAKNYISQSALESAEATYKSAKAQVDAQIAQAGLTKTQADFYLIKAPYDAVISALPVTLGDMATPGKTLLTIYDANQLRVTVAVPQSVATAMESRSVSTASVIVNDERKIAITSVQILPAADQATHTRTVRINLPKSLTNVAPGMNVKVSFPVNGIDANSKKISIPTSALVTHAEMTGVYVISQTGEPLLRQLRLGETHGDQVEVLSGLSVGEEIAIEPQTVAGSL